MIIGEPVIAVLLPSVHILKTRPRLPVTHQQTPDMIVLYVHAVYFRLDLYREIGIVPPFSVIGLVYDHGPLVGRACHRWAVKQSEFVCPSPTAFSESPTNCQKSRQMISMPRWVLAITLSTHFSRCISALYTGMITESCAISVSLCFRLRRKAVPCHAYGRPPDNKP